MSEDIPSGWERSTLGNVASLSNEKCEPSSTNVLRYIGLEHIESGSQRITGVGSSADVSSTKSAFRAGNVLYGKLRPYLKKVCRPTFDGICSTDILVFSESPSIDNGFLLHFLSRQETASFATQNASGINLPRINSTTLGELAIGIPPLAEQRRIVAKIEALQERSRKAREALSEVGPLMEQFRQSLLAAAFRGNLTADWRAANPNVEPALELLKRIRQERHRHWEESELTKFAKKSTDPKNDKWKDKYPEPQPFKFDGHLPEIPPTWEWTNWDTLTMWITYGFTRPMPHVEAGPMIVTAKNVRNEGLRLDVVDYTTEKAFAELNFKDLPIPGDILIIKDGATTGRAALVPEGIGGFCINQSVGVVWLKYSPMNRLFLLRWVQSPLIQKMIQEAMSGMAMPHLSVTDFKAMPVPIPPLKEQLAICEIMEGGLDFSDRLRDYSLGAASDLTQLDQSILAKAFRGELVPQDPNDEPASVLLERIRKQRHETAQNKNLKPLKATKHTKKAGSVT